MGTIWQDQMMKIRGILWPDEWLAAMGAGGDLLSVSRKTTYGALKIILSLAFPFFLGSAFFYLCDHYFFSIANKIDEDALRAVVMVVAILAGFMITTILFTGRPNGLASLTSHELRDVRDKVSYLVLSQCLTLASHIICVVFCLICIAIIDSSSQFPLWAGIVLSGLVTNSILRALILPLQIWEVHAFAIDVEISERMKSEKKIIDEE